MVTEMVNYFNTFVNFPRWPALSIFILVCCSIIGLNTAGFAETAAGAKYCVVQEKVNGFFGRDIYKLSETDHSECLNQEAWSTLNQGFQEYIDVIETNAQSVNRWFGATQIARSGDLKIHPISCDTKVPDRILLDCALDSLEITFSKFLNPFGPIANSPVIYFGNDIEFLDGKCFLKNNKISVWLENGQAEVGKYKRPELFGTVVVNTDLYQRIGGVDRATFTIGYCDHDANYFSVNDGGVF